MNPSLTELKPGDMFWFADRICTIKIEDSEPVISSLSDEWEGFVKWQDGKEGDYYRPRMIEMPKTPLELHNFVQEHQVKYDERLQV